ncbi:MAG: ribosome maturation factor RimP [Candidatus Binatia bacterium]
MLSLAEPLARSMGLEVLTAEIATEMGRRLLRVYLDKEGGAVTIQDCEAFSQALSPILDVEANVPGSYHLEVSSPGLNRPLVRLPHFQAQVGKIIQVQTEGEIEGRRHFKGSLLEVLAEPEAGLVIRVDGRDFRIPLSAVRKAHLDYFAGEGGASPGKKGFKK